MNGAIVKLDSLSYSYGAGAEYKNLFLIGWVLLYKLLCLVLLIVGAVKIRSISGKLGGAGVNHLINRVSPFDSPFPKSFSRKRFYRFVEITVFLCGIILFLSQFSVGKPVLKLLEIFKLVYEPFINFGNFADLFRSYSAFQSLEYTESAVYVHIVKLFQNLSVGKLRKSLFAHGVHSQLN